MTANSGVYVEGEPDAAAERRRAGSTTASGYHFATEVAILDTTTGESVEARRPSGRRRVRLAKFTSQSYGVYDKGDRIIFRGGVRAKINRD